MKKICIFCGSSMGFAPIYRDKAAALGQEMALRQCELLYGAASVGLMKVIADVMLEKKCKVVGTITHHLKDLHVGEEGIDELYVVDTMAERKKLLEDMAEGFIAMPGGFGTLDELFEVVVLSQLRVFDKPVALYNVNGYFDKLIGFINHAVEEGFIRQEHADNLIVSDDPKLLLDSMERFQPVTVGKWISDIHKESGKSLAIIGITGTLGAGKGTIVDYLVKEKGFVHYSVRAFIAEEITRRGMEVNRDTLTLVANELRATHSPSYITDQLFERAKRKGVNAVIESVRALGEIYSLRQKGKFCLFAVDADQRLRYERIHLRGSETDHVSFETFKANELREMNNTDPTKQNLGVCIEEADFVFMNNGTIEALHQQVEKVLSKL